MSLAGPARRARLGLVTAAWFCVLLLLGGCASGPAELKAPPGVPTSASVPDVPFFAQKDHYCGPASLAMVLAWSGLDVNQDTIAPEVYTPGREGTLPQDLVSAARRRGRVAVPVRTLPALYTEIAAGHPVLVFQNLGFSWYSDWHFAVVTGYTLEGGTITLHSGTDSDHVMSVSRFERSWSGTDNWGLVVVPPDVVPASADEPAMIDAAIGLERADRPRAAAAAYAATQKRWPDSYGAAIGLGNASFAAGDYPTAETAFRRATMLRPSAAPAWNNLATVLAKRGKVDAALYTARRAVETGRDAAPYRATLKEVEAKAVTSPRADRNHAGRAPP